MTFEDLYRIERQRGMEAFEALHGRLLSKHEANAEIEGYAERSGLPLPEIGPEWVGAAALWAASLSGVESSDEIAEIA